MRKFLVVLVCLVACFTVPLVAQENWREAEGRSIESWHSWDQHPIKGPVGLYSPMWLNAPNTSSSLDAWLWIDSTSLTGMDFAIYVESTLTSLLKGELELDGILDADSTADFASTVNIVGALTTGDGVGAKNGAAVTVSEVGDGAVHKTVFTLTALSITMTDADAAGSHGSHKLYDFPAGVIQRLGCSYNLTTTAGAGGLADDAALVGALGSTATATDNATLTTTEADFIASTSGTLSGGGGTLASHGPGNVTGLDGHTTAIALRLNLAVPDAGSSANDTVAVSGTVTCVWSNVGDY